MWVWAIHPTLLQRLGRNRLEPTMLMCDVLSKHIMHLDVLFLWLATSFHGSWCFLDALLHLPQALSNATASGQSAVWDLMGLHLAAPNRIIQASNFQDKFHIIGYSEISTGTVHNEKKFASCIFKTSSLETLPWSQEKHILWDYGKPTVSIYTYICMCFQSVVRMTANRICKIGLDDQKIEFYPSAKRSLFTLHWSALVCSCDWICSSTEPATLNHWQLNYENQSNKYLKFLREYELKTSSGRYASAHIMRQVPS